MKSIFNFLHSNNRDRSKIPEKDEGIPKFKNVCCMKYTLEEQCKRCPFRQIKEAQQMLEALKECRERRRGTYLHEDITIEYNSKYW